MTPSRRPTGSLSYKDLKAELGPELLTLEEVLGVVAGRAGLHVDLKEPGFEAEIVHAIIANQPGRGFLVTTGEVESIRVIKAQFPSIRAGLTLGTDMRNAHALATFGERWSELFPGARLQRSRADFVAAHQQLARIRLLAYCARRQMDVWVWTVDEEREIARFMADRRVATLITNRPDVAMRFKSA